MSDRIRALALLALLPALATGCTRRSAQRPTTEADATPPQNAGTIGLSVLTMNNPFFKVIDRKSVV